uniref:Uncharacterized protein n=1 Tax=Anguilla anguilla TaxID=7936 RepID=A0A0E9QQZ0_ANGAN
MQGKAVFTEAYSWENTKLHAKPILNFVHYRHCVFTRHHTCCSPREDVSVHFLNAS